MAHRSTPLPDLDHGLSEFIGDGDWTTRGWPTIAEKMSTLGRLDRVRDELAFAFPPEVCLSLARRGEPMVMAPLFVPGIVPQTESLIALGNDLTMCSGWREKTNLLGALRSPGEFAAGRFEVAAWSALERARLSVEYERPPVSPDGKVADFFFREGHLGVALEAKRLPISRADANREAIHDVLREVAEAGAFGTLLTFTVNPAIVDAAVGHEPGAFEALLSEPARQAIEWARQYPRRLPLGSHKVPGLGVVDVRTDSDPKGMTWTTTNIEEDSKAVSVKRALRLVLRASDQVHEQRDADIRAVVVHASRWRVPVSQAAGYVQAMLKEAQEADLARYRRLDAVLLVNAGQWHVTDILVLTFRWSRPRVESMNWVRALTTLRVG